jgi:hypothetical protein
MRATIHDEAAATARDMARRPLRPLIRSQQIQMNTTAVFLILMDWAHVGRQAGFMIAFVVLGLLFRKLMAWMPERDRWFATLIWLALCGFGADRSGLHYMVGAFLAGAIIDSHWFDQKQLDALRHHVLLVMMPVYFLSEALIMIIFANETFTALLLMAVASTMLTVPVRLADAGEDEGDRVPFEVGLKETPGHPSFLDPFESQAGRDPALGGFNR